MSPISERRPGDPSNLGGYEIRGRLGEGGQGVVYLGVDEQGRQAAVKWLRPHLAGDAVAAERFAREAAVSQRVAPFCTAKVLATGVHEERPFIVSEYVDGPSLQQVVSGQGPRTEAALHRLAIGTATALAAIHQAGIVHRDFSPNNVLLGGEGARVIDFGIARALDATSTITSMPVGTPAFMAPEQILAHPVGPAADIFAWAATMAFAASGRGPFDAENVPAIIQRVLHAEPDLSGLSGPLRDVIASCLAKDPGRRPTAEQVILRLLEHPATSNPDELRQAAAVVGGAAPPGWRPPGSTPASGPPSPGAPGSSPWPPPAAAAAGSGPVGAPPPGHATPGSPPPGSGSGPQAFGHPSGPQPYGAPGSLGPQPYGMPASSGPQPYGMPASSGPQPVPGGQPPLQPSPPRQGAYGSGGGYGPGGGGGPYAPTPPPSSKRSWVIGGTVAAVALVAAVAIVVVTAVNLPVGPRPQTSPTATPTSGSTGTSTTAPPSPAPSPVPTANLASVKLDGTDATLYESPSDPVRLTTYMIKDAKTKDWVYYSRNSVTGAFTKYPDMWESMLSPDGRYLAQRGKKFVGGYDTVDIINKVTGERYSVRTSQQPLSAYVQAWSRDSTRVLVNVGNPAKGVWQSTGFAIVDVAARKATIASLREGSLKGIRYGFDNDDTGVVALSNDADQQALRFFTPDGTRVRRVPNVGAGVADALFSPSGGKFVTNCPGMYSGNNCVYDSGTGAELRRVKSPCTGLASWYDEDHLACWVSPEGGFDHQQFRVIDFTGKEVRTLLDVPADAANLNVVYTFKGR